MPGASRLPRAPLLLTALALIVTQALCASALAASPSPWPTLGATSGASFAAPASVVSYVSYAASEIPIRPYETLATGALFIPAPGVYAAATGPRTLSIYFTTNVSTSNVTLPGPAAVSFIAFDPAQQMRVYFVSSNPTAFSFGAYSIPRQQRLWMHTFNCDNFSVAYNTFNDTVDVIFSLNTTQSIGRFQGISGAQGPPQEGDSSLECVNGATGWDRWANYAPFVPAAAACAAGVVLSTDAGLNLHAINATTGHTIWMYHPPDLNCAIDRQFTFVHLGSDHFGVALNCVDQWNSSFTAVLSLRTGKRLFQMASDALLPSRVSIGAHLYFTGADGVLTQWNLYANTLQTLVKAPLPLGLIAVDSSGVLVVSTQGAAPLYVLHPHLH